MFGSLLSKDQRTNILANGKPDWSPQASENLTRFSRFSCLTGKKKWLKDKQSVEKQLDLSYSYYNTFQRIL